MVTEQGSARRWFVRLSSAGTGTLRRLAVRGNLSMGAVIALAPSLSPRPGEEHVLYYGVAGVLAAAALVLTRGRRWHPGAITLLAIGTPTVAILVLLSLSTIAGVLPILLIWSALTTAYFGTRASTLGLLVALGAGLALAVVVSPDPRLSAFSWVVTMVACSLCAVSVRVIAERGDRFLRSLDDTARRDALTGLLNRRGFDDSLSDLWLEHTSLTVTFYDLDHFKAVNDTHGHEAGDKVLQAFARVLRDHVRDVDVVARTGGEEFGVVMPAVDGVVALDRAERVVDVLRSTPVPTRGAVLRCTVSAGVAVRTGRHRSAAELRR
ncbi:diguanylate cyclase, partial [Cellulomonas bogoriensis 69B4 = DSM 16987]